jgi:hypothetical protein
MKNAVFGCAALVRRDVSEECIASIIRVTRIGELGIKLAVTSNRITLRRNTRYIYIYIYTYIVVLRRSVGIFHLRTKGHVACFFVCLCFVC